MLSLPAALAGLVLGVVLAELLVPAITLTSAATAPVPPVLIEFGWSQTLPLALAVAVLPVLAAALTIARRPTPPPPPRRGGSVRYVASPARAGRWACRPGSRPLALARWPAAACSPRWPGPRRPHTRTEALQQTLAGLPSTTKTVQVSGSWGDFTESWTDPATLAHRGPEPEPGEHRLGCVDRRDGRRLRVRPAAAGRRRLGQPDHEPAPVTAGAAASAQAAAPPKMEVSYRDPFASHARLVAGTFSSRSAPAGSVAVAASTQIAARFGLHPGSRLTLVIPSSSATLTSRRSSGGAAPARPSGRRTRPSPCRPW